MTDLPWWAYALLSALFAAFTALLAKVGVQGLSSHLATAIRTGVVLVVAGGLVLARGQPSGLREVSRRTWVFLVLSGLATGASWLAYFRALQLGPASKVAPLDKLSLPLTVLLAGLFLGEPLGWRLGLGVALMTVGALLAVS